MMLDQFIADPTGLKILAVLCVTWLAASLLWVVAACRAASLADRNADRLQGSLDRAAEARGEIHIRHIGVRK